MLCGRFEAAVAVAAVRRGIKHGRACARLFIAQMRLESTRDAMLCASGSVGENLEM